MLTSKLAAVDFRTASSSFLEPSKLDTRKVVNVVIAKDFNFATDDVQIQALEVCWPNPLLMAMLTTRLAYSEAQNIQPNDCPSCAQGLPATSACYNLFEASQTEQTPCKLKP